MKTLRFFISSPGDVFEERAIANRVIERLQSEYIGKVVLEPVLWENEPLVATSTFQHQIVKPSDTDVVIAILWSRLGTKLPKEFVRPDGSRFESGTEYEFEEAIEGYRKNGKPDLLVYRKTAPPSVRLDDEKELLDRLSQKKKLDEFVDKWFHDKAEGTLTAAFHVFEAPSDFENLLENHLHRLIDRQIPASLLSTTEARAVWKEGSPFRGLEAFEFEHAPVFFGRTKAVSDILQALRDQAADGRSFVLVLGMSGGGKSSVVRAGVLPMLTRPGVIEGVDSWRRAIFRPTDVRGDLFVGLAKALLRENALPSLDEDNDGPEELAQVLRESPQAATSMIKGALSREKLENGKNANARLALLVDQMEEMYTQEDVSQDDREAFVDVLDVLARCGRVWVIGTLRSDFYQAVGKLPKLVALKEGDGQYDLMAPTASEMGQMIRLPTRAAGLRFEEDPASSERLDDMLRDAAAEHPEVLPLLQFTLEELYQRRTEDGMLTLAAYRELGGVEGSLAQRAETVFKDLPDDVEAELPKVLNALVSIERDGYEQIGRKRALWSEATKGKSKEFIEAFVENRLFVTELADDGSAVVTVAHEALLWHWPRVKEWVAQNRENLRIRSRITAATERWIAEDRPSDLLLPSGKPLHEAESLLEQDLQLTDAETGFINASFAKAKRFQRLKRGVVAALAMLSVVAATSAYFATEQRDLANQERSRAEVEAETARRTTEFMVDLFSVSDPSESLGNSITAREILDKGAERIETELADQPEIQATLKDTMGTVYTSLALYNDAVGLLESALETRKRNIGAENPEIASSLNHLGEVLGLRGDFEQGQALFEQALALQQSAGAGQSLEAAISLSGAAEMLTAQGEYAEADKYYTRSLEIRQTLLGDSHAEVAQILQAIGFNYQEMGEFEAAEKYLRDAVRMRRELHGSTHPDLAAALSDLGTVVAYLGDFTEAEKLFRESLDIWRKVLGQEHADVALGLNHVAWVLQERGDLDEAETLYREAIDVQKSIDEGESHPKMAVYLSNLAFVMYEKGEFAEATSVGLQALDLRREVLGSDHPDVADGAANLAYWSMQQGRYSEAESLLDESLHIRRETLGDSHPKVGSAMILKAGVQVAMERFEEGRSTAEIARNLLLESLPPDHWLVAAAKNAEGAALTGLGRYDEAEQFLLESDAILGDAPMPGIAERSKQRLVVLYKSWGKENKAEQLP